VKNTFIDVDHSLIEFVQEEMEDDGFSRVGELPKRQMSEPAMKRQSSNLPLQDPEMQRQTSLLQMQELSWTGDDAQMDDWARLTTAEPWNDADPSFGARSTNAADSAGYSYSPQSYTCPVVVPVLCGVMEEGWTQSGGTGPDSWDETTSRVTMSGIPEQYNRQMLTDEINLAGFQGSYNGLSMPVDKVSGQHKGYAVFEFVMPGLAWNFKLAFHGSKLLHGSPSELISVTPKPLPRQGKNERGAEQLKDEDFLCADKDKAKARSGRRKRGTGSLIDLAKQRIALAQRAGEGITGVDLSDVLEQRLAKAGATMPAPMPAPMLTPMPAPMPAPMPSPMLDVAAM